MKIGIASQFFFTFDVVAVMLFALIRERRWIKLTIVLLSLIAIVSFIVTCIIGYGILKAVL